MSEHLSRAARPPKTRADRLVLDRVSDIKELAEEWSLLAQRSGNVFATPEWIAAWWRHFGGGRELVLTGCRDVEGRLVAVLPLYVWRRRPLRILRFVGHGPGDELGPVCAPEDRPRAAGALVDALEGERFDVLVAELLPQAGMWGSLLPGSRRLTTTGSPLISLQGKTWDDILAACSRGLRQRVRRLERALRREHDVRFRLADDPARLDADLDVLFRLHAARWGSAGSTFLATEPFQREFAARAAARGWLRLWFLEIDGAARAAWLGFRFAGAECYYQAGRDPAWDGRSVGFVLLVYTIRAAVEDGAAEYRFLRGGEDYKYRFASSDPGLETVALARSPLGAAAVRLLEGYVTVRRLVGARR